MVYLSVITNIKWKPKGVLTLTTKPELLTSPALDTIEISFYSAASKTSLIELLESEVDTFLTCFAEWVKVKKSLWEQEYSNEIIRHQQIRHVWASVHKKRLKSKYRRLVRHPIWRINSDCRYLQSRLLDRTMGEGEGWTAIGIRCTQSLELCRIILEFIR